MAKAALLAAAASAVATAVIKFDPTHHGGTVRGAVNGQRFSFPVDVDVTVTEDQLSALRDSNAEFTVVTPLGGDEGADEGSSAPSTTIVSKGGPLSPENGVFPPVTDEEGKVQPTPELGQKVDEDFLATAQEANTDQGQADKPLTAAEKARATRAAKKAAASA